MVITQSIVTDKPLYHHHKDTKVSLEKYLDEQMWRAGL